MCSHIIKIENILNRIFILLPESCPGVGLVGARGSKTLAWGFAMAPHRLCALDINLFSYFSIKSYVVGTQNNGLNETVILSGQNMCFD